VYRNRLQIASLFLLLSLPFHIWAHDSLYVDSIVQVSEALGPKNPKQARKLLEDAREICLAVGYGEGEMRLRLNLANWESDHGSPVASLEILQQLDAETTGPPEHPMRGAVLHNIGRHYQSRGAYTLALEYYLDAKDFFELNQSQRGIATIYGKLAFLYKTQGNLPIAQGYYERAAAAFAELGNWPGHINMLHNLGFMYEDAKQYAKAESLFVQVKTLSAREDYALGSYLGQFALAVSLLDQGRYDKAEVALLALADSPFLSLNYDRKAGYLMRIGELRMHQGQSASAIQHCKEALAIAESIQSLEFKKAACKCLADTYEGIGDHQKSIAYLKPYYEYRDSLQTAETKILLEGVRAEYDFEKVEKDLAQSELARIQEQSLRLEAEQVALNQKRVRIFVLVLLALAVGFIAWFIHTNRRIQRKNHLIQATLSEKEVLLGEVHHRVKNNLQLISSIIDLQARSAAHAPTTQLLGELRNRIHAITLLHQQLYQQPELHAVRTREYLPAILENLRQTQSRTEVAIDLSYEIDAFSLPVGTAITLGLIVSELVTNAYRHAFSDGRPGEIRLLLTQSGRNNVLRIEDNGKGMHAAQENFGMHMIRSLVRQMKASIQITTDSGTQTEIQWLQHT
jgi:two-component system, sensor histidine kinase PdtaS